MRRCESSDQGQYSSTWYYCTLWWWELDRREHNVVTLGYRLMLNDIAFHHLNKLCQVEKKTFKLMYRRIEDTMWRLHPRRRWGRKKTYLGTCIPGTRLVTRYSTVKDRQKDYSLSVLVASGPPYSIPGTLMPCCRLFIFAIRNYLHRLFGWESHIDTRICILNLNDVTDASVNPMFRICRTHRLSRFCWVLGSRHLKWSVRAKWMREMELS